jgi:hypothetical protein
MLLPTRALANGEPAQGKYDAMPEHAQSSRAHLGASRPTANKGRIHECVDDSWENIHSTSAHKKTKKPTTSNSIVHPGACFELQR